MTSRRSFLKHGALVATGAALVYQNLVFSAPEESQLMPKSNLRKAIKLSAVGFGKTMDEKFESLRAAGFEGVEADSPTGANREEIRAAAEKTGIKIHGVIDSVHWKDRFSDPDEAVRARGVAALKTALDDAKFYGASTVLVVPGKVSNNDTENYQQCWDRSQAEIRKAIPLAEQAGVKIGIEVVWNNFITKPEELVKYVDQFESPWVGAYFDSSNMIKFGVPSATWIRALGKRMLKMDFKGYSKEKGWVKIGDGDEDWPEVIKALDEVGYHDFVTAEVGAPTKEELEDVSARMKRSIGV